MVEEPLREAEIGGCEIWRNGSGQGLVGTRGECTIFPAVFLENATSSLSAPTALSEIINAH